MKKLFLLLVLTFLCSVNLYSQSNLQSIVQVGVEKLYNMEFKTAEKYFNRTIDEYPEQPNGYYRIAQLHFWIFLGTRDPGEYFVFLKFADLALQKIDKILDDDEKNYRLIYMAGNLESYKAMAYATNNSTVDAIWASKKAVDYFNQTLELNPKYYNAYLGLGIFDYAMGFVPDFLKWAVNLSGLSSDKERGLHYIKTAFNRGTEKTEAAFHLAKIYTDYLAEYDSAYIYLNYNLERNPSNTLFIYQYAVTLIKHRQLDRANDLLNKVIRINNTRIPQLISLAHYRKGEINFKKNKFKEAAVEYEKFLSTTKEIDFEGIASLNAALCYKFLGDTEQYEKYLASVGNGNQDIFEDAYAKTKADEFSERGITEDDEKLIRMHNYLESARYRVVFDSLKSAYKDMQTNEAKAAALIYFSDAALYLKKYAEANTACEEILAMQISKEKWIIPNAYLNMALANYYVGGKTAAIEFLGKANDNNSFEFKDWLQARIEHLKRRLNRN